MGIAEQLSTDLKEAMRSRDQLRVEVIRMARAALQSAQQELAHQAFLNAVQANLNAGMSHEQAEQQAAGVSVPPLTDQQVQQTIMKEVKRRRDAVEAYQQAGRPDRAETEAREAAILEAYLPRMLSADDLRPQVAAIAAEIGAHTPADMARLMPVLMERFRGQAEGRVINQLAREILGGK